MLALSVRYDVCLHGKKIERRTYPIPPQTNHRNQRKRNDLWNSAFLGKLESLVRFAHYRINLLAEPGRTCMMRAHLTLRSRVLGRGGDALSGVSGSGARVWRLGCQIIGKRGLVVSRIEGGKQGVDPLSPLHKTVCSVSGPR